jgi:hypothetical protein
MQVLEHQLGHVVVFHPADAPGCKKCTQLTQALGNVSERSGEGLA